MSTTIIVSVVSLLFLSFVSQNFGQKSIVHLLDRTLNESMNCGKYNEELPVIAFSTKRFMQAMAVKRRLQNAYSCTSSLPVIDFDARKENTWGFCVLGLCIDRVCRCPLDVGGNQCERYNKKCWLIYCFLICENNKPTLRCMCSPSSYGKTVQSNHYWYDDGLKRDFIKPPPGWKDDLLRQDDRGIIAEIMSDLEDYNVKSGIYPSNADIENGSVEKASNEGKHDAAQAPIAPATHEHNSYASGRAPYNSPSSSRLPSDYFESRRPSNSYNPGRPSQPDTSRDQFSFNNDMRMHESFQHRPTVPKPQVDLPVEYEELQLEDFSGTQGKLEEENINRKHPSGADEYPYPNNEEETDYSVPQEDEYEYYNKDYEEYHNSSNDVNACLIAEVISLFFPLFNLTVYMK